MKLSNETIVVLKNFAEINGNLLIQKGSVLKTISAQKGVMAEATVDADFPREFGIYDLNSLLGALSLFDSPDLDFDEKWVTISSGKSKVKYFAADASILVHPSRSIKLPAEDVSFNLDASTLASVQKTASVLRASDVSFSGEDGKLILTVGDKKNVTGNSYCEVMGDTKLTFKANIRIDNLKLIPGDYTLSLASAGISRFVSSDSKLTYFVALESDSTFTK